MLIWKNSYEIYVLQLEEQIISPYNYLVLVVLIWIVVHKNPEKERGDDHILKSFFLAHLKAFTELFHSSPYFCKNSENW